jgi:hypothetical protein
MMRKIKFIILNCIIIVAVTISTYGQKPKIDLKDTRVTLDFEKSALGYIFRDLIVKYDIAIGFEESTLDREHNDFDFTTNLPSGGKLWKSSGGNVTASVKTGKWFRPSEHWFTVKVENEKLENVLNSIVSQMENYRWEITDDVVNIIPIEGRDKRYEKLLELKIKQFTLEDNEEILFIRNKLLVLPEFETFLKENNLNSNSIFSTVDSNSVRRKLPNGLNFSKLTFKDLLNNIVKVKRGGWILKQHDMVKKEGIEYIDIDI